MTANETTVIDIRGLLVGLGPLSSSTLPLLSRWRNDFATARTLNADPAPRTMAAYEGWYNRNVSDDSRITFVVYDLSDMAPVGTVGLFDIDLRHRTCEVGVGIFVPDRRGKGLGTEAVILVTDYAFHGLGMHNVHLAVLEFNHRGMRAYRRAGFSEYARRRESRLHNGHRWDMVFMDALSSEWDSPVMEELMAPDQERPEN